MNKPILKTHYTYLLIGSDYRVYVGVRSCIGSSESDKRYLGSSRSEPNWSKDANVQKVILNEFESREDAVSAEKELLEEFNARLNPLFVNMCNGKVSGCIGEANLSYDFTVYSFYNYLSQETFEGTQNELITKYKLHSGHISQVVSGVLNHHKCWVIDKSPLLSPQYRVYTFFNALTNEVVQCTTSQLVSKYDLDRRHISKVLSGKNPHHKGWSLNKDTKVTKDRYRVFKFFNKITNDYFTGTKKELCEAYSINHHSHISSVTLGKLPSYKGWQLA